MSTFATKFIQGQNNDHCSFSTSNDEKTSFQQNTGDYQNTRLIALGQIR